MFVFRITASMFFACVIFTFLVRFFIFVSHTQYLITCEFVKHILKINHFRPPTCFSPLYFYPSAGVKMPSEAHF